MSVTNDEFNRINTGKNINTLTEIKIIWYKNNT